MRLNTTIRMAALGILSGTLGYLLGVQRTTYPSLNQPAAARTFVFDTLPAATMQAMNLKNNSCRLTGRSAGEFEAAHGVTLAGRSDAYGKTYRNCWVAWTGKVVDIITWPDAYELIVEDSLGGRARVNAGPLPWAEREYLKRRWFIVYFGRVTGEFDGTPIISDAHLWPSPSLE